MNRPIGIDLGTTYSAIAYIDDFGKPMMIKNPDGLTTTPSVVFVDAPNFVVGEFALQSTLGDPDRVVQFIKRFMGVPDFRVKIEGENYSPEFISSIILRKLVQEAEDALGESVSEAVITVPAYFTESQRQATYEAAKLAGLKVLRVINEPTAAALNYGMAQRGNDCRVLVFDLGGGTFDVTILEVSGDELSVIGVGGDSQLGGKDFDERLMNYVEEHTRAQHGQDLEWDPGMEAELRLKCETAKRQLSARQTVPIQFKLRATKQTEDGVKEVSVPVRVDVMRQTFEDVTSDLLLKTQLLATTVLQKSRLEWADIDEILCVGGSSKMPMVREMLTQMTGKKPVMRDPDECVALGAAVQAGLLTGNTEMEPMKVNHVLSHSLGVAAKRGQETFIDHAIPALTPLPCAQIRNDYTTTEDNQTSVQIHIYEGESSDPNAYSKGPIGEFNLDVSPPRPAGVPQISVEFRCDEDGQIIALARDQETGQESRTLINLTGARQNTEMQREQRIMAEAVIS